jgi:tetratricopeptide (TPR) repeat protein
VTVESLGEEELVELLLKAAGIPQSQSSSYSPQAKELINVLGSHTLAVIQAGAFIAAGHCRLDQYVELFQRHHQRMLRYQPRQAISRYGNVYSTFDATLAVLNNEDERGADASCLLDLLSTLHPSPVPSQVFEDAWKGLHRIQESQERDILSDSTHFSQWHLPQLPEFVLAKQPSLDKWDPFRLNEACHLLESLALLSQNNLGLSMHPLVHAWAKNRQSSDQQAKSWLTMGSIIALSSYESPLWQLNQMQLRPHVHSFLDVNMDIASAYGPDQTILEILLQCGRILVQMRDDSRLADLLNYVFKHWEADSTHRFEFLLPFYQLSARNFLNVGRHQEAVELLERILEIRRTTLSPHHPDLLVSQHELAKAYLYQGLFMDAGKLEEEVIATSMKVLGPEHPFTLASMNTLASVLRAQGSYERAEELYAEAVTVSERLLGKEHPITLASMIDLAETLSTEGKYEEAELMLRETLEVTTRVMGKEHPQTLINMNNLASVLHSQRKHEQAEDMNRQVLAGNERVLGVEHPDTLRSLLNLASVLRDQGKYEEAEELNLRALNGYEKVLGPGHPGTLISVRNMALLLQDQGRLSEAKEMYERALAGFEKAVGRDHHYAVSLRNRLRDI